MKNILFVCTGNTCRSSMAEALLKKILEDIGKNTKGIKIKSAGTAAMENQPATPQAISVMREMGIDLSSHRATLLTPKLIDEADLILTMTLDHKRRILEMYPEAHGKVYLLKEFVEEKRDFLKEIDEINKKISQKRRAVYDKYKNQIGQLMARREKLKKELEEVESRLEEIKAKMDEAAGEERKKLLKLETKLKNMDIKDPFGQPVDVYRKVARDLEDSLQKLVEKITKDDNK